MASKGYVVKRAICDGTYSYPFASLKEVFAEWREMVALGALAIDIFRVHDDGREERLPSYEEALAMLDGATSSDADPLAALEAAERRLLEAGGWTEEGPDKWSLEGVTWDRRDAVGIARYHAAKGGA